MRWTLGQANICWTKFESIKMNNYSSARDTDVLNPVCGFRDAPNHFVRPSPWAVQFLGLAVLEELLGNEATLDPLV